MLKFLAGAMALLMASAACAADDPQQAALRDEAFQAAQRGMASTAAAALSQLGARFSAGDGDLARAVRARQDLEQHAAQLDRQVMLARAAPDDGQASRVAGLRAEGEAVRRKIEAADSELRRRFPDYAELAKPQPISIADVQKFLLDDEALVLIYTARRDTFVWAATRDGVDWNRAPRSRDAMIAQVKNLRAGLNPRAYALLRSGLRNFDEAQVEGADETGRMAFDRAGAFRLYEELLKPFEALIGSKRRLFTVVNAPFDSLPFAVLPTRPPEGPDADPASLRATHWLIRRQSLVSLPSASSLRALRAARNPRVASEPFRGYGAPVLGGGAPPLADTISVARSGVAASLYRGGAVDRAAISQLAPLPQTEGELKALAAALGAGPDSVRLGAAATVSAVLADDLAKFRIIAFATHGLLAGELSGLQEPALVFTPPTAPSAQDNGLLTASQAAKLDLAADWVILSACNTAAGDGAPGAEGFSGLARAFFYAGAKSLLVSHWPVRDDVAARLTTRMFASLRADDKLAKAEAHRRSVLELLDDLRDPSLAHPAVWAPFVVVGEGR